MGPIYNQGKIIYSNGNTDYIAYSYDVIVKSQINYIYDSIDSDKPNDSYIDATWQQPDKYKQVVKIEFIYNETHPITSFAENVFSDEETTFYLSDIPDSMPNLKEIKIGEGFRTFERGYCFKGDEYNGLGNVEKIDLPSTFESVGGYVGFGATTDNFMVDIPTLKVLILRNPVPPKFYDENGNEMVPENSFKRLGSAVVYVPDAAVETYKSNPVFADLNIQPLSSYQEPGRKTVFPGKVKGKFEINGKEIRKFYINDIEYYNISKVIIVKKNYIEFADSEVKRLCVENWGSDGKITYDQAAAVTNLNGVFSANTAITSFDELQYFTGLQEISNRSFDNCTSLTSVTIPDSVTTIGERAFAACLGLTSVTIPNSVTTIGNYAFGSCSNLISITMPNGVTTIGNEAFTFCSNLTAITIPDSVTTIGGAAFSYCPRLTNIAIPSGVTAIGASTFRNCTRLTSITIPDNVTSIGNYAFSNCSSLTAITIPSGVTIISNSAFSNCSSLTSITIPSGVTNIYSNAFSGCSSLTSITSLALTAPLITLTAFRDVSSGGTLYVPTNATGYDVWMGTGNYYLGKYNWTLSVL